MDVGDFILVTIFECWCPRDMSDAHVKRLRMLVTKTAKTVTNISELSLTHFAPNIRHQHRCYHDNRVKPCKIVVEIITKIILRSILTYLILTVCLTAEPGLNIYIKYLLSKVCTILQF